MQKPTEAGRRPVCTIRELATLATEAVYQPGTQFKETDCAAFYRKALTNILSRLHQGKVQLVAPPDNDNADEEQRLVTQNSALAWWDWHLLPPARLTEVITPPIPSDPRGDYSLKQLAALTYSGPAPRTEAQRRAIDDMKRQAEQRILNSVASGELPLVAKTLSGSTLHGSTVTRHVAADWLLRNGFNLPPELGDLQKHR